MTLYHFFRVLKNSNIHSEVWEKNKGREMQHKKIPGESLKWHVKSWNISVKNDTIFQENISFVVLMNNISCGIFINVSLDIHGYNEVIELDIGKM